MRPRVLAAAAALLLLVGGAAWWLLDDRGTRYAEAVALAPADSQRVLWTDWTAVRAELDVPDDATGAQDLADLLDRGFRRDLTTASSMPSSAEALRAALEVSPATVDWEVFAQSETGATVLMHVPDAIDDVPERLRDAGFTEPDDEDGVWLGGPDVTSRLGTVSPEFSYFAVLADHDLLVSSDDPGYLEAAVAAVEGDGDRVDGLDDAVDASGEPLAAVALTGDYACEALAMAGADASAQEQAAQLVAQAGQVSPYDALVVSLQPGDAARVTLGFADQEQARENADSRAVLAAGPAVGQGGDYADLFGVDEVRADDGVVTIELTPEPEGYVLSDLTSGPVLLATC